MSIYDDRLLLIYFSTVAVILGAVFGSFLNCAAWRIAHRESFLKGRSRCPACGHTLRPAELIPVLSWLLQRGKCRACGAKISVRYPLTELFFALLTLLCLRHFDLSVLCLRNWVLFCCLFCLSLVDLEICEIPDGCLLIALGAWLLSLPFLGLGWKEIGLRLLAGLLFGGALLGLSLLMDRILKRDSLGGGDIKLLALMGLYLGFASSLFALMLACVLGLLFAALLRRLKKKPGGAFPFGPSISLAWVLMMLYGEGLVNWYLGLL